MRVQPIIERLSGIGLVTIGGALEYAALTKIPGRLPAAFVVPQNKSAAESRRAGVVDQKIAMLFAVVIILPMPRSGAASAATDLEEMEAKILERMIGWTHPDADRETQFADASMLSADGTGLAWGMRFRTSYHFRKAA